MDYRPERGTKHRVLPSLHLKESEVKDLLQKLEDDPVVVVQNSDFTLVLSKD